MKRYARFVVPALVVVVGLLVLLFFFIEDALVYFRTPTEVVEQTVEIEAGSRMRLGGQVEPDSVTETDEGVDFAVGDGANTVQVSHTGSPAQLFNEGIGVVVEGTWDGSRFHSDTMIIKHDEQYRTEDGQVYEPGEYPTGE